MVNDRPFLAFYEDNAGTLRVFHLKKNKPSDAVDAGKVSKPITLWAKNITGNEIFDVRIFSSNTELEISPSRIPSMKAEEMVKITLVWSPSLKQEDPLKVSINSTAREIRMVR